MAAPRTFRFDDFLLDVPNRTLTRGATAIEINSRYFDALALLVAANGALVEKQRFFDAVWGDTIVTDAALTQCIKDVRRALGDDAGNPRFIRTVPGHGYRFIAPVEELDATPSPGLAAAPGTRGEAPRKVSPFLLDGLAGTLGGGAAGVVVGLVYGSALASSAAGQGLGMSSVLLVMLMLTVVAGLAGGFGVAFGMAAGRLEGAGPAWSIAGALLTGFVVGGLLKLLGTDAINLLFGHAPAGITGALEGAAMGFAIATGAVLAGTLDASARWRPVLGATLAGAIAGALLTGAGGSLMGGSLELLSRAYDGSRLDLDSLGRFFGEPRFGPTSRAAFGALEGAIFGACVTAAMVLARRASAR